MITCEHCHKEVSKVVIDSDAPYPMRLYVEEQEDGVLVRHRCARGGRILECACGTVVTEDGLGQRWEGLAFDVPHEHADNPLKYERDPLPSPKPPRQPKPPSRRRSIEL